jgi:hypothetical protein
MVNKNGFLRVVEATIAVMIVLGALLLITINRDVKVTDDLTRLIPPILDEIAQNETFRIDILETYDTGKSHTDATNEQVLLSLRDFAEERIRNSALNHSMSVCELNVACPVNGPYPVSSTEDLFTAERVVGATLDQGDTPRRLKMFLWKKP